MISWLPVIGWSSDTLDWTQPGCLSQTSLTWASVCGVKAAVHCVSQPLGYVPLQTTPEKLYWKGETLVSVTGQQALGVNLECAEVLWVAQRSQESPRCANPPVTSNQGGQDFNQWCLCLPFQLGLFLQGRDAYRRQTQACLPWSHLGESFAFCVSYDVQLSVFQIQPSTCCRTFWYIFEQFILTFPLLFHFFYFKLAKYTEHRMCPCKRSLGHAVPSPCCAVSTIIIYVCVISNGNRAL